MKGRSKRHWVFLRPVSMRADSRGQRLPKPLSKDYTSCLLCCLVSSYSAPAMVSEADAARHRLALGHLLCQYRTKIHKHLKLSALHQLTAVAALGIQAESGARWSQLASERDP